MNELQEKLDSVLEKSKPPKKWVVIIHNDDFTPFEFVENLLQSIFGKSLDQAQVLTSTIHVEGKAVIAEYSRDIAQSKVDLATIKSVTEGFPLLITCEEEEK